MSHARALTPVLGHVRVLRESPADPTRRLVEEEDGRVLGAAAYEELFGPHAEGVVAVRDVEDHAGALRLLDRMLDGARAEGIVLVRFVLEAAQLPLAATVAATLPGAALASDLEIRLDG